MVGGIGAAPVAPLEAPPAGAPRGETPFGSASPTMIGVARPGIAPLNPGAVREEVPAPRESGGAGREPLKPAVELGATYVFPEQARGSSPSAARHRPVGEIRVMPPTRRSPKPPSKGPPRRAMVVLATGAGLAVLAVFFGLFWHGAPPITALAKLDAQGKEVLEVRCPSCPDGTQITLSGAVATMNGQLAAIPLAAPLTVGDNPLKIQIDRPGKGRDEEVRVNVQIAYRIKPDLTTLQGEHPAIQVVVEAVSGTTVTLDGQPLALANGRATQTFDVTDALTGVADDQGTLSRQIPYVVKTPEGTENGSINVSIGILPLHIDAPGAHAVTDGKSFVLAGRPLKGADVVVAGRSIPVNASGAFAQVMNVSSVGSTQIEVRAKMAGMAPRLVPISVKRVDSLETAAAEFTKQELVAYSSLAGGVAQATGKPIVLGGEVGEVRHQNHQTVMLFDVSPKSGCPGPKGSDACRVRLVQGADNLAKSGDLLTIYGTVGRSVSVGGKEIPEIVVDFTLKGLR
jgi:hypothetical protein